MKFWTNAKKYMRAASQALLNIGVSLEIRAFCPAQTSLPVDRYEARNPIAVKLSK